jgi:hypothetical protein
MNKLFTFLPLVFALITISCKESLELTIVHVNIPSDNECFLSIEDPQLHVYNMESNFISAEPIFSVPFINGKATASFFAGDWVWIGLEDNPDCITQFSRVQKGIEKEYPLKYRNDFSTITFRTQVLFNDNDSIYFSLSRRLSIEAINFISPVHSGNQQFGIAFKDLENFQTRLLKNETYEVRYGADLNALRLSSVQYTFQTDRDALELSIP